MGRTGRRRKRRKRGDGHLDPVLELKRWLCGWRQFRTCGCRAAVFPCTGRGLMATRAMEAGRTLIRSPLDLVITVSTASASVLSTVLLPGTSWHPHQVLAAYLVVENHLGPESFWFCYLKVLPSSYDSPVYTGDTSHLPPSLTDRIDILRRRMLKHYSEVYENLSGATCQHCGRPFKDIVDFDSFRWAWFTVNSRCVYIPPQNNTKHDVALSAPDSLALVPYLDLLNHSDAADVSVSVRDGCYTLVTNIPFKRYEQIFINYGCHDNTTLYLEYGFVLPDNRSDSVPLSMDEVVECCPSVEGRAPLSERKRGLISSYSLSEPCLSWDGLSWTLVNLIALLLTPQHSLSRFTTTASDPTRDPFLEGVCRRLLERKGRRLEALLSELDTLKTDHLSHRLFDEHLKIVNFCKSTLSSAPKVNLALFDSDRSFLS